MFNSSEQGNRASPAGCVARPPQVFQGEPLYTILYDSPPYRGTYRGEGSPFEHQRPRRREALRPLEGGAGWFIVIVGAGYFPPCIPQLWVLLGGTYSAPTSLRCSALIDDEPAGLLISPGIAKKHRFHRVFRQFLLYYIYWFFCFFMRRVRMRTSELLRALHPRARGSRPW